jgi:hypothetical protein
VRRALILLAVAGCVRASSDALSSEPSIAPLVVGRSPHAAFDEPSDAGPAVESALAGRDAAVVWTGCHVDAKGQSGAPTHEYACVVEQEADPHVSDSGRPLLWIFEPRTSDPSMRILILRDARPFVGVQPNASFTGIARIKLASGTWTAETSAVTGITLGTFKLALTRVRAVRDAGLGTYELHGTVDAQLLPDWQGTGVGYIDLHADF